MMARSAPSPVFTLRSLEGEVTALTFVKLPSHGDEELLITGHSNGKLQLWSLKINRVLIAWSSHGNKRIKWVGTSLGQIFSYGADGHLYFWEITSAVSSVQAGCIIVDCCTHCPCDVTSARPPLLAVPHDMDTFRIITVYNQEVINSIKPTANHGKQGMLLYLRFVEPPTKLWVLAGYENGAIILWNPLNGEALARVAAHKEPLICMDFHETSMHGISGSSDDNLAVWQITDDLQVILKQKITITNPGVNFVKIHPKGTYVACAGWDCRLRIFSWKKHRPLAVLNFHNQLIHCLCYSRESGMLAAGSRDGRASFWNLYNS